MSFRARSRNGIDSKWTRLQIVTTVIRGREIMAVAAVTTRMILRGAGSVAVLVH